MYTHNNATNVQWAELEDGKGVGERMGGGGGGGGQGEIDTCF